MLKKKPLPSTVVSGLSNTRPNEDSNKVEDSTLWGRHLDDTQCEIKSYETFELTTIGNITYSFFD